MELNEYQTEAQRTNLLTGKPQEVRRVAAMLGLATEAASLLDIHKRELTDAIDVERSRELFEQELGDLLWYVAAVATANDFSLDDLALKNLDRTQALWEEFTSKKDPTSLRVFDAGCPDDESFPRQLEIEFTEGQNKHGKPAAQMRLVSATPNAFPNGRVHREASESGQPRWQGFTVGDVLRDPLTDNNRRINGYRYHDAIHLGFLATLNWSATTRSLLHVKRGSDPEADESEDGARAIFAEEGLAAVLSRLARRRMGYREPFNVDGETLEIVKASVEGLEVETLPGWAWRRAIIAGFSSMYQLNQNGGGILTVDLEKRELTFRPLEGS